MLGVKHIGKDSNGNVLTKNWSCVASDASGKNLAACVYSGSGEFIYISNNFGETWSKTAAPQKEWTSITMDPSGQYLTASSQYNGGSWSNSKYGKED